MHRRGFTVVEIIITVTIMGILLVLAVVNVNASQVKARDDQRKADVEAIAIAFESFYRSGSDTVNPGTYPGTDTTDASNVVIRSTVNDDLTIDALLAPGAPDETTKSLISATNTVQTEAGVTPQPTIAQYVYQPLDRDGNLCASMVTECRKFNLYYQLEADETVYKVTSRNQ